MGRPSTFTGCGTGSVLGLGGHGVDELERVVERGAGLEPRQLRVVEGGPLRFRWQCRDSLFDRIDQREGAVAGCAGREASRLRIIDGLALLGWRKCRHGELDLEADAEELRRVREQFCPGESHDHSFG